MVKDGTVLSTSAFTRAASISGQPLTGLVDARRLLALVDEGATVVLQGLHRSWPRITELVARLETELGHPGQANAYLTPAGSQGFAPHRDTHDVFVIQTEGEKVWLIGEEDSEDEVLLTPGSVLYLPTGTRHSARSQASHSLHVTVGINQVTWRSLVERAVRQVVADIPDTHLPAGYLEDPDALAEGLRAHLDTVSAAVAHLDPAVIARAHVEHLLTSRPPRLAGGLAAAIRAGSNAAPAASGAESGGESSADPSPPARITDDTVLTRRPTNPGHLAEGPPGTVRLLLGDRRMDAPDWLRPALVDLLAREQFTPRDLADLLDPQSRLVLCRRLVREGLLTVGP
ncbi:MAG: cupin domain-containing protein [Dermatophilaceae bacterium]